MLNSPFSSPSITPPPQHPRLMLTEKDLPRVPNAAYPLPFGRSCAGSRSAAREPTRIMAPMILPNILPWKPRR